MNRLGAIVVTVVATLMAPGLAAARSRPPGTPVPRGFVGVNIDGPMVIPQDRVSLPAQFGLMRSNGVQSVRATFAWADAQPYASWSEVPAGQAGAFVTGAGGIPTNFAALDQIVAAAAGSGMTVLPTVMFSPIWDAGPQTASGLARPRDNQPYGRFLTTLIGRYGPRGSFWGQHPELPRRPIRMWEIWNEPDLSYYWATQPFVRSYLALLRVARSAVKRADPGAQVVLGALPNASWRILAKIYRVRGARGLFDLVDIHAYTRRASDVTTILAFVRGTMNSAGDRNKPMILGETGWMSSLHQTSHIFDFETTEAGQAHNTQVLLPLLAAKRQSLRLRGFYWYTWMGDEYQGADPFNFSGLLAFQNGQVRAKPALAAFGQTARRIER
jgi:hypothetical protein